MKRAKSIQKTKRRYKKMKKKNKIKKIKEIITNASRIYYALEEYSWSARHIWFQRIQKIIAPKGAIIITLTNYPYGVGSQWDIRESFIICDGDEKPKAHWEGFSQDWALLEKCPPGESWGGWCDLEEISPEKAIEIVEDYEKTPQAEDIPPEEQPTHCCEIRIRKVR
jgi:hypothetical protein